MSEIIPYEVGYKKPPQSTQFQKGRSGNPKGRKRGSKNRAPHRLGDERLKALLLEEAYRVIPIQEAGKAITMPMAQAIIRSVAVAAAKGNHRAQQLFLSTLGSVEEDFTKLVMDYNRTMMDYKHDWQEAIAHCKAQGLPVPNPVPHPDHIHVDWRTGEVTIRGPVCEEEREKWEALRKKKHAAKETIDHCKADLRDPNCEFREFIEEELAWAQKIYDRISEIIPD